MSDDYDRDDYYGINNWNDTDSESVSDFDEMAVRTYTSFEDAEDKYAPDHYVESIRSVFTIRIDELEQAKKLIGKSIYKKVFSPFPGFAFQIKLHNIDSVKFSVSLKNCGKTSVTIKKFNGRNIGSSRGYNDTETKMLVLPGSSIFLKTDEELCKFHLFKRGKKPFVLQCSVEFILPKFSKNNFYFGPGGNIILNL
jgi:hypothetical protein